MEFLSSQFDGECVNFRFRRTVLRDVLRLRSWNGLETFMERLGNVSGMTVLYSGNVYEIEASILLELKDRDFKRARTDRDQSAPKRKIKKEIKNKRETPVFDFEKAYASYPRKMGKELGMKKCISQIKTESDYNLLLSAIKNYSAACKKKGAGKDFIFKFSNFMNQWRDYVEIELTDEQEHYAKLDAFFYSDAEMEAMSNDKV